jgi:flagellar motor switch protein FliG
MGNMEEVTAVVSQAEKSDRLQLQETVINMVRERPEDAAQLIRAWLLKADCRKAAVFLVTVGLEMSSRIFKYLGEGEVETLTFEIIRLELIEHDQKDAVLQEFHELIMANRFVSAGGIDFARELLERSFGSQKAIDIINRLTSSLQVKPFDFIRRVDPANFLNCIQAEHPQTIALILAYIEPDKASIILQNFPLEVQSDVAHRIATIDRINPEILHDLELVLEKKLSAHSGENYCSGGVESIIDILNRLDRATERQILEALKDREPELAEEIKRRMFVFEDIVLLDDRSIQKVMREVDASELAKALMSADAKVQNKIFRNMSKRAACMLKEDMEFMGPVRLIDVEECQQKIVSIIRYFEDTGEIVIARAGDEMLVEGVTNPKIRLTFNDVILKTDIDDILEQIDYMTLVTALKLSPSWMYKKLSKSMPFFKRCKFKRDVRRRSVLFEDIENAREEITAVLSGSPEIPAAGDNDD